jgi:hypothetical protein
LANLGGIDQIAVASAGDLPGKSVRDVLKEFVGLRTTTVFDVNKYESVLWFSDMPHEPECQSPAWSDRGHARHRTRKWACCGDTAGLSAASVAAYAGFVGRRFHRIPI